MGIGAVNPLMLKPTSEGAGGATPTKSLRFDSASSSALSRTFSNTGDSQKFTFACWVKRTKLGTAQRLFQATGANEDDFFRFNSDDTLGYWMYQNGVHNHQGNTTSKFRDVTGWMHICYAVDTTQYTAADRVKIFVNGVSHTLSAYPDQNTDCARMNTAYLHYIGRYGNSGSEYMDNYVADVYFVDGSQVNPVDSFIEKDATSGVYKPKVYDLSSAGSNSFHLDFEDSSDVGNDVSGNDNDLTAANLPSDDCVPDIPTNNFCTYNALWPSASGLSEGNLKCTTTARGTFDAMAIASYWEITANTTSVTAGVVSASDSANTVSVSNGSTYGFRLSAAGALDYSTDGASWTSIATGLSGIQFPYATGGTTTANFGQSTQSYSTPSGYDNLTSANLTATIADPTAYFQTKTFDDGDGAKTFDGNSDLQPDLVWLKSRGSSNSHKLVDSVRGVEIALSSDGTDAEATESDGLTTFGTDGFTVGDNADYDDETGDGMVAWGWKEGATQGFDIVSYDGTTDDMTFSAQDVSHSLGVAPEFVVIKNRTCDASSEAMSYTASDDWIVWHKDLSGTDYFLKLNSTSEELAWDSGSEGLTVSGTSSISVNNGVYDATDGYFLNWYDEQMAGSGDADSYIAYLFSGVAGYSKFGTYTGATALPYVHLGFAPAYVLIKRTNGTGSWNVADSTRQPSNLNNAMLQLDATDVEGTASWTDIDFTSNGFKLRGTDTTTNGSGDTYIYAAFAEAPAKYSLAR